MKTMRTQFLESITEDDEIVSTQQKSHKFVPVSINQEDDDSLFTS